MIGHQIAAEVAVVDSIVLTTPFEEPECTGLAHCHFVLTAMRMCHRPLLRSPQHYWATEYAKWRSGEQLNADEFTRWYFKQCWDA
jgi:hypothetical protein